MFRPLALLFACAAPVAAQPLPDLVTDRPDFTESGVVVPVGHVQIEAGATATFVEDTEVFSGPELLVRWTPVDRIELRFGAPDYAEGDGVSGFADPSVGLKAQFGPLNEWDLGLIATVSLPVGDDALSTDSVDPELILTAGRALSPRSSLGGQVLAARDGSLDTWTVGGTLVVGLAFAERLGMFFEVASSAPEDGESETILHHGYTFLLTSNVQLDAHAGLGLTVAAPDFLVGAGLTVRR